MDLFVEKDTERATFGDIVFINGESPVTDNFTNSVEQRVFVLLRTFESEWFLNDTTGVPYTQEILGKKVTKSAVDRIIQQKVLQEEGVASITKFSSTLDGKRVYEAAMTIKTTQGTSFEAEISRGE